jgi:hypothetical protein
MHQSLKKLTSWTVILTLLTLVAACSSTKPPQDNFQSTPTSAQRSDKDSSQETVSKPSVAALPKTIHNMGEVVTVKDKTLNFQFQVNGIREHQGKGVIAPNSGNKWIVVSSTIVNKGQEPKTLSVVSFELRDSKNNQYEVALLAAAMEDVKSPTGQIKSGEKRQGEVAFEVPEGAEGLKLLFQPNRSACEAVVSKPKGSETLNCEPVAIELK